MTSCGLQTNPDIPNALSDLPHPHDRNHQGGRRHGCAPRDLKKIPSSHPRHGRGDITEAV